MTKDAIVFTITNNYTRGLEIFLHSYKLKNNYRPDCIIIEEEPILDSNKQKIVDIYPNSVFKSPSRGFDIKKTFWRRKWSINPANRFSIFLIKNYEKIIFFDADMIVTDNIESLFSLKEDFSAVYHPHPDGLRSNILYPHSSYAEKTDFNFTNTFNAGLMVISKTFLNETTANNLFSIYKERDWLGNQGPLNVYFNSKVNIIDSKYFVSTPFLDKDNYAVGKIFHFAGSKKPWTTMSLRLEDNFEEFIFENNSNRLSLQKLLIKYRKYDKELLGNCNR
jgi:lipopolysaccharide biosynthesis glycosyltransferase